MKKLTLTLLTLIAAAGAQTTHAMNYSATNTDTLLVFRDGINSDVEFNLGSVSNLLALPNGTVTNISYDTNLVKSTFNNSFAGVKFVVLAATDTTVSSLRLWATDASATVNWTNVTGSKFGTIRSKIESVGNQATAVTVSNNQPFVIAESDANSYAYVVTGGSGTSPGTFNGDTSPITVEAVSGSTMRFFEVAPSAVTPKPASKWVGSFTMDATTGKISYTAGTNAAVTLTASRIVSVLRSNGVNRVSFTTTNGNNYRLLYSTNLSAWFTNTAVGTIAGNNATNLFNDTNAAAKVFYRIQSY